MGLTSVGCIGDEEMGGGERQKFGNRVDGNTKTFLGRMENFNPLYFFIFVVIPRRLFFYILS